MADKDEDTDIDELIKSKIMEESLEDMDTKDLIAFYIASQNKNSDILAYLLANRD